jgi:predicted ABC-type ATPase
MARGKTTLTNRLRAMGLDFGEYINADEIALTLPASPARDLDSQQEASRRRAACLAERRSFSFETVMSHESKIEEMHTAKATGYEIMFIGISLEAPEINVARVALRVREGGHDVPKDRIIARYERTMRLMPQAIMIADRSLIFDNSDSEAGPILMLSTGMGLTTDGVPQLDVRVSDYLAKAPGNWIDRYIVGQLKALCQEKGIQYQRGTPLKR